MACVWLVNNKIVWDLHVTVLFYFSFYIHSYILNVLRATQPVYTSSLHISSSTEKYRKLFHSNFRDVFQFFYKKYSSRNSFLVECLRRSRKARPLQAASAYIKGLNFGANVTHLCDLWLDVSFFSHVKKHRLLPWFARTHLRMKNLRHSFLVSISQYVYNKVI